MRERTLRPGPAAIGRSPDEVPGTARPAVGGVDEVDGIVGVTGACEGQGLPGGAAVDGLEHAAVGRADPAVRGVGEAGVGERLGQADRRDVVPCHATVAGAQDHSRRGVGRPTADGPAVQTIDEAHRPQIGVGPRLLRLPGSAAVGAVLDEPAGADGPDVGRAGERAVVEAGRRLRHLPEPAVRAVGRQGGRGARRDGGHDGRGGDDETDHPGTFHVRPGPATPRSDDRMERTACRRSPGAHQRTTSVLAAAAVCRLPAASVAATANRYEPFGSQQVNS